MWNRNKHECDPSLKCGWDFSISDVYFRELLHFIFEGGSLVYNYDLQELIIWIERLRHLKAV